MNGSKTGETNTMISRAVGERRERLGSRGEEERWWERRRKEGGKEIRELRKYSRR